jgi:hypothetical protein
LKFGNDFNVWSLSMVLKQHVDEPDDDLAALMRDISETVALLKQRLDRYGRDHRKLLSRHNSLDRMVTVLADARARERRRKAS